MELTRTPIDWNLGPDMTYLVSNSEAANFLSCEMKHFFAHILNLEPKSSSISLSRGVIGHEAMAEFYESGSAERMQDIVDGYFVLEMQKQSYPGKDQTLQMLNELKTLLTRYVEFQRDDKWEILEVEKSHVMDLFDHYGYGMRLDLLIRYTTGPYAGEVAIVDHKFMYDFPSVDTLEINAQIPKYLATVRNDTGLVIKHGLLNVLRHRLKKGPMSDDEMFRREIIKPTTRRVRNIMREQIQVSERIMQRHSMPVDEAKATALRALNPMICKNCSFLRLCMTDLEGQDTKLMMETEYQPNSYGYNGLGNGDE